MLTGSHLHMCVNRCCDSGFTGLVFCFMPPMHSLQRGLYAFTMSVVLSIPISVPCQHWLAHRASCAGRSHHDHRTVMMPKASTLHADQSISMPTWTPLQVHESIPMQKWYAIVHRSGKFILQMLVWGHQMTVGGLSCSFIDRCVLCVLCR